MNLRKQVEPLLSAAFQASSPQRHAHHATPRLAWVMTLAQTSLRNHHEQSRSFPNLSPRPGAGQAMQIVDKTAVVGSFEQLSETSGAHFQH
jgi:hypothetical protein